jgi:hypothetical protein
MLSMSRLLGAAVFALIGCAGQQAAPPPVPARPTGFSADFDPADFDHVTLRWDPAPPGTPQPVAYLVEAASVGLDFFPAARLPGTASSASITMTGTDEPSVRFRLSAYGSEDESSRVMTGVLEVHRGFRPPKVEIIDQSTSLLVKWTFLLAPNQLRVERRVVPFGGPAGEWQQLLASDVPFGSGLQHPRQYEQRDLTEWRDGTRFEFRVTGKYIYVGESGVAIASSAPGKPLTPVDATAVWENGRIRASWKYPGRASVDVGVVRIQPAGTVSNDVLSPQSSFDEAAADPGVWHYELTARIAGTSPLEQRTRAETVVAEVLVPDTRWAGALSASLVRLPRADVAVRARTGGFGLLRRGWCCSLAVHAPDGSSWSSWTGVFPHTTSTDPMRLSAAPLSFDPAGALHVFYEALGFDDPGSSFHIHHRTWSAAAGWSDEEAARTWIGDSMPGISAVDAAGSAQLVWSNVFLADPPFGWKVRNGDATWVTETITAGAGYVRAPLATDPDRQPVFVTSNRSATALFAGPLLLVRRATNGTWSSATLSDVSLSGSGASSIVAVFAPTATDSIVVYASPAEPAGRNVWVRTYDGTKWSEPELAIQAHPGQSLAAALSNDGSRLAVAAGAGGAPALAIRSGGKWTSIPMAPSSAGVAAGANGDGTLWILQGLDVAPELMYDAPAQDLVTYVLYEL